MPEPTHLECHWCGESYEANKLQTACPDDGRPLLARYDLDRIAKTVTREEATTGRDDLWRFGPVLPVEDEHRITLGEGATPLLRADGIEDALDLDEVGVKDESHNPTGTFKSRGMAMAVSRALELGAERFVVPSAGNAGAALSAYAARAKVPARIVVPEETEDSVFEQVDAYGAEIETVEGLITDAGDRVSELVENERGWFDMSTLKEPYRLEGKKTMGYELAAQTGFDLPDVIVYPTGGGTGLIGMWKAFEEMEQLGWIDDQRPRLVSAQAAGCAPIVDALENGDKTAEPMQDAHTVANGLRVPEAIGDFLILEAIRDTGGAAVAVSDEEILEAHKRFPRLDGVSACTEGAATLAALEGLVVEDAIEPDESVVVFNTGAGWTG
jgi:threonine synthase